MNWQADSQPNVTPIHAALVNSSGPTGPTFSLATLLILVTVFSFWMGLVVTVPELAVAGPILLLPAFIRGIGEIKVARREGHVMTLNEKGAHFYYSFLTVVLIYMIGFGAMFTLSIAGVAAVQLLIWALQWEHDDHAFNRGMIVAVAVAWIVPAILSLWLYWRWWPRKVKRPW